MRKTVHGIDHYRNEPAPPLVGALLRRPFLAARRQIVTELHQAGFTDLAAAHLAVFQHPGPQGRSPTEITQAANTSKQAVNNLLTQLERAGYLRRTINPENHRERLIELTPRGQDAIAAIRTAVRHVEERWEADLGPTDYHQLRSLLTALNHHLTD